MLNGKFLHMKTKAVFKFQEKIVIVADIDVREDVPESEFTKIA